MTRDRIVLLGVTGSIAAYKAVELVRRLTKGGAEVHVIMTPSAPQFVTPLTFRRLTHRPVVTRHVCPPEDHEIDHIALAERADRGDDGAGHGERMAKMAAGIADDMLSCTIMATTAPVLIWHRR